MKEKKTSETRLQNKSFKEDGRIGSPFQVVCLQFNLTIYLSLFQLNNFNVLIYYFFFKNLTIPSKANVQTSRLSSSFLPHARSPIPVVGLFNSSINLFLSIQIAHAASFIQSLFPTGQGQTIQNSPWKSSVSVETSMMQKKCVM